MTPPKMKIAFPDSEAYFRISPSCHASGMTPPKMKIEQSPREISDSIFELIPMPLWGATKHENNLWNRPSACG
jgi:hypothetical protein